MARRLGPGGRLWALDLQPEMLAELERRARSAAVGNLAAVAGDGGDLPFRSGELDAAFLVMVLGEVERAPAVLREVRRVLAPGGRLVVAESPIDPHFVGLARLRRWAEEAGFVPAGVTRSLLAYFACFEIARLAPQPSRRIA